MGDVPHKVICRQAWSSRARQDFVVLLNALLVLVSYLIGPRS